MMALFSDIQSTILTRKAGTGLVDRIIQDAAFAYMPSQLRQIKGQLETGGVDLLIMDLASRLDNKLGSQLIQDQFRKTKTKVFGGITPHRAVELYQQFSGQEFAKENLFLLEVSSPLQGDFSTIFNLFARSVSYQPFTITGDRKPVGGLHLDTVTGGEPVDLRITTLDDKKGTLQRWFNALAALVTHEDGTFGVPADYATTIKVVHSYFDPDDQPDSALVDTAEYRPVSIEVNLDRESHELKRLDMVFTQVV
jgi:hypothetical protein